MLQRGNMEMVKAGNQKQRKMIAYMPHERFFKHWTNIMVEVHGVFLITFESYKLHTYKW